MLKAIRITEEANDRARELAHKAGVSVRQMVTDLITNSPEAEEVATMPEIEERHRVAVTELVRGALDAHDWRLKKSAVALEMSPQALRRAISRYGIWDDYCAKGHPQGRPVRGAM